MTDNHTNDAIPNKPSMPTDPSQAFDKIVAMGRENAEATTPKTTGSRLSNAAKTTAGQATGGIAGGVAGTEIGKSLGGEAGKAAGKAAANAAIDAANHVTFGLANLGRGAAEKIGEGVGGAAGKLAGGLAGNSAGSVAGSELGGKAAKDLGNNLNADGDPNHDKSDQKDDLIDKALQKGGQKVTDGAKTAANVGRAMNALNPANLAAKAGAAVKEGIAALGKNIIGGIKAAGKFIADKAVAGAKAVGGFFKGVVAKGSELLGHVGLHGSAATATSAVVTTSLVVTPIVGGPVAIYNANKIKNSNDLFALCLAYANDKSQAGLEGVTLPDNANPIEVSAQQSASESKLVSVMRVLGHSDVQIAGTISNFRAEGSSDPTVFEYGKNWGGQVFMSSQDQGGAFVKSPQKIKAGEWSAANPIATTGQGFGYGQMTPAGPFFAWSKLNNKDAFDPGVQLAYQMSSVTNNKYPWKTYLNATKSMQDPKAAASWFYYGWEYPGYGGQASAAPPGVQKYADAHIKEADNALNFVKTVTTDKAYADGVISAIQNDVEGGAQNNVPSNVDPNESNTSRPDFCDDLDGAQTDTAKAKAGTGVAPASDLGKFMKPSELSAEMKKFVEVDPAQYGLDYGSWNGWEGANGLLNLHNEGIWTTCTQLVAALGYKMYGIRNVSGNGYELVGKWQGLDPQGKTSSTPQAGAIFSFSPGSEGGNNHTGIVSHVFANGDILAVENGIMSNPSPTYDIGTWSYHVYPKATMDKLKTSYFMPSVKAKAPTGDNFFGSK